MARLSSRLAQPKISKKIVSAAHSNEQRILLLIMITAGVLSAFLNNSATTAMFITIIIGIALTSGGKIHKQKLLMPLTFACNAGGMLTLVGSTPTVIVQGVLTQAGYRPVGFFEFGLIGLPVLGIVIIYMATIGSRQLSKIADAKGEEENELTADIRNTRDTQAKSITKKYLAFGIMGLCVFLFATGLIPTHLTSMLGAFLCLVTGCLKEKENYRNFDWTTIFVLAGSLGSARGLELSRAGQLIADTVLNMGTFNNGGADNLLSSIYLQDFVRTP